MSQWCATGVPEVIDTGTLGFRRRAVRLLGVEGEGGRPARQLARYLRRRSVTCALPEQSGTEAVVTFDAPLRCRIDGNDLASLILSAGGARPSADAPPDLLAAEEQALSERAGLWRRALAPVQLQRRLERGRETSCTRRQLCAVHDEISASEGGHDVSEHVLSQFLRLLRRRKATARFSAPRR